MKRERINFYFEKKLSFLFYHANSYFHFLEKIPVKMENFLIGKYAIY